MAKKKKSGELQGTLFPPVSTWELPDLSTLPSWAGEKKICIDVETRDTHLRKLGVGVRRGGYMTGISFAIKHGPKFYLPMRHEAGDNLDPEQVLAYIRHNAAIFTGDIVGANLSYDLDYLWAAGIHFPQVRYYRDIQIAEPLIDELQLSYSLDNIAKRYGLEGKREDVLREAADAFGVDPKSGMWQLAARYVGEYAESDADQPLHVIRRQEELIEDNDLWDIYNLESEVLPVLVKMRQRGVRIDQYKLADVEAWALREETQALAIVKRETFVDIGVGNVWKAEALAPALKHIGVKLNKTTKGQFNIDKDVLASVDHPVAKSLAWARKVNKLRTTFAASIRTHMIQATGRVHCTFNQIARETESGEQKGARYGRLSATHPNLQQQPSRDEFAAMWRSIYLPEEGALWACNDFSQQEPRWTTHYAATMDLEGARVAAKAYRDDPTLDNHQFMADVTGLDRKIAKALYLGLCYGEGGAKLSDDLGLPTRWALSARYGSALQYFETHEEGLKKRDITGDGLLWRVAGVEGQSVIDEFNQRAPFIRLLATKAEETVKRLGQVRTVGGRLLHFDRRENGSYWSTHKALNRVIQGSSADQTKRALINVDKAGHHVMLQVHDELDNSVADVAEGEAISKIMEEAIQSKWVPFRVDLEIGPSWGEIK
jgi:DNA polymerase I-like protein with 3'-5' exonuclease and polymerase domains